MSTRRQNILERCPRCQIRPNLCFCEHIPKISTKTKISLIVHIKERVLSSNTAQLAHLSLENSEFFYRGLVNVPFDSTFELDQDYTPLYLFPSEESVELTPELLKTIDGPVQLVVPDGSWRQAKKFHKRIPQFKNIQHVKLAHIPESIYELRKQRTEKGVCTLEAIAHALGVIENVDVKDELLKILKIKNERVKESRTLPYNNI